MALLAVCSLDAFLTEDYNVSINWVILRE
jgi:hypothetical protein